MARAASSPSPNFALPQNLPQAFLNLPGKLATLHRGSSKVVDLRCGPVRYHPRQVLRMQANACARKATPRCLEMSIEEQVKSRHCCLIRSAC